MNRPWDTAASPVADIAVTIGVRANTGKIPVANFSRVVAMAMDAS